MSNLQHYKRKAVWLAVPFVFIGCGGGSGGGLTGIDGSGSPVTVASLSAGPITGFGSVFVNGRRFVLDTTSQVTVDSLSASQDDLRVGQFVVIRSSREDSSGNAIADSIQLDTNVTGQVSSIDPVAGTLVVLGQTVKTNTQTLFDDDFLVAGIAGLQVNDPVEISGMITVDGSILATRIELKTGLVESKLRGVVSALNDPAKTFQINNQVVNYSTATLNDLPNTGLIDGLAVKVEGAVSGGVLQATKVEGFDDPLDDISQENELEIKGSIVSFISATDFEVSGIQVTTNGQTQFEGGTVAGLVQGAIIEVSGSLQNGILLAEEIQFEQESSIEISATLTDVQVTSVTGNSGQLSLLGLTGSTAIGTRFADGSSAAAPLFGIDDLSVGDFVQIKAVLSGTSLQFTEVKRENAPSPLIVEIQGAAENLVAISSLNVAGVAVTTQPGTQYRDTSGNSVTAAVFFADAVGKNVKAEGAWNGAAVIADQLEIED